MVKNKSYNFIRNCVKNVVMGNMGKVSEESNLLTCIVNNKNKFNEEELGYRKFFNYNSDIVKELSRIYHLAKPKKYIIQNIDFDKKVYITCHGYCDIIIKNCRFNKGLMVENIKGNCNVENCYIKGNDSLLLTADELIINRVTVDYCGSDWVKIIGSNKLSVIDSVISSGKCNAELFLSSSDEINIKDYSSIYGEYINFSTPFLFMDDESKIKSDKIVKFNVIEFDKINVKTPYVKFNNNDVRRINQHEFLTLKKIEDPLSIKRLHLINTLKLIKEKCEKENEDKFNQIKNNLDKKYNSIKENLDNRPITKILK